MACKLQWVKKILPTWQLKTWLFELRQDVSAVEIKTVQQGHLWPVCPKCGWHSKHDLREWENFSLRDNKDSGDISGICRVHLPDVSDVWKLSATWVPKCLNVDQKHDYVVASQEIFVYFRQNTVSALHVTMDETWIYLYNPETKESYT